MPLSKLARRTALGLAASAAMAAPIAAQTPEVTVAECRVQAQVVMQVVEARAAGQDQTQAVQTVAADLSGETAKYQPVVGALADWVYGLPSETLGAPVGDAWVTACAGQ